MSDPSAPATPPAPPPPPPPRSPPPSSRPGDSGRPASRPPRPPARGGALAALALLLALVALAGVAFGGWQWWQWRTHRQAGAATVANLGQRVTALEAEATAARSDRAAAQKASDAMHAASQALDQRVDGVSTRVAGLEDAVAGLARNNQQGRKALLLDQAELLLHMGQARYTLFHDASGALKAFALADQSLAAADDPAVADVRRTLAGERKALAATHPATRADDLVALARLRSRITQLPLRPLDAGTGKPAVRGFWQRAWHALSTAVIVRHTGDAPETLADAHLTRQLAALDVAQAEAARAAWDGKAFHAALEHVDLALATAFDAQDPAVREARAQVARMLAEPLAGAAPVDVGEALRELRNVRAVQRLQAAPADAASAPAAATSAAGSPA